MFNSSQKSSVTIVRHNQSDKSSKVKSNTIIKQTPSYKRTSNVRDKEVGSTNSAQDFLQALQGLSRVLNQVNNQQNLNRQRRNTYPSQPIQQNRRTICDWRSRGGQYGIPITQYLECREN